MSTDSAPLMTSDSSAPGPDLLSSDATRDPYGLFGALRNEAPVCWSDLHRAWLIFRYDDVAAALTSKALSSDRVRPLLAARRAENTVDVPSGEEGAIESPTSRVLGLIADWMVVTDPPAHTRLRRLAAGAFKTQRIAAMDDQITRLVDSLLDSLLADWPADGSTARDLIEGLAYPLPAIVIATMLGVPVEERDRFREWSDELALVAFGTGGTARAERHERALRSLEEMDGFFRALIGQRRAALRRGEPGDDMLTAMMDGDPEDPNRLDDDELVGMCALLLFAGHETTTNSIANAILALLRHPAQLAALRSQPALLSAAVEELLRYDGPIKVLIRWVAADTEIGGRQIAAGERVYLAIGSANHDPAKFSDPDSLDISRSPNPHIAFGRGVHACIGAQIARLETRIAVARIVERLPRIALAEEPVWKESLASRSMTALWLTREV